MRAGALLVALAIAGPALASDGGGRVRILAAAEVAALVPRPVILDARGDKAYREGHVPGSLPVAWEDWTAEKPGVVNFVVGRPAEWGKVPPADAALVNRLRSLGLSNGRTVVVVGQPFSWGEGRIAWNLLYWGAEDVVLLDGGFPSWVAEGRPVEAGAPPAVSAAGDFALRLRDGRRVDLESMRAMVAARTRPILDARTREEFAGAKVAGQARGGHIPGARLVPVRSLFRPDGRYLDAAALAAVAALEAGALPVTYCTGGVRSSLLAVLLEARLGVKAANYDGSIWEWSSHAELPME